MIAVLNGCTDAPATNLGTVGLHRIHARWRGGKARAQTEPPKMIRACDFVPYCLALRQGAIAMGAGVVDNEVFTPDSEYRYRISPWHGYLESRIGGHGGSLAQVPHL